MLGQKGLYHRSNEELWEDLHMLAQERRLESHQELDAPRLSLPGHIPVAPVLASPFSTSSSKVR